MKLLRERVATLAQAIRDKDIETLMAHYAPDVVVYDVMPPLDVKCAADYRQNFERYQWLVGHEHVSMPTTM